jgi:hypothetical protein
MTTKSSAVMHAWFRDVWCNGRPEAIHELFAADGLAHGLGAEPVRGPAAFLTFWHAFRATFSNIQISVLAEVDEGPLTYVRCAATMQFRGRPVTLDGGCLCRIQNGQIAECWNTWDFTSLLVGMGALPADVIPQAFGGATFATRSAGRLA